MADTSEAGAAPPRRQRHKKSDWRVGKIRNKRLTVLRKAHAFHKCTGARVNVTIFYKHKWFVYSSGRKPNPLAPRRPEWPPSLSYIRADFECEPEIWHAADLENVSPGRQFIRNPKKPVGAVPPPPLPQPPEPVPDHRRDIASQEQPQGWWEATEHSPDGWSQDGDELSDGQITDVEDDMSSVDSWRYWVDDDAFAAPSGLDRGEDVDLPIPKARSFPVAYEIGHDRPQLATLEAHHAIPRPRPDNIQTSHASEPDESSYPSPPRTEGSAHMPSRHRRPRFHAARDMFEDTPPACSPTPSPVPSLQAAGPDCTEEDVMEECPSADVPNTPAALHGLQRGVPVTVENETERASHSLAPVTSIPAGSSGKVRSLQAAPKSKPPGRRPRTRATTARMPPIAAEGGHGTQKHVDFFIPIRTTRSTRSNTHLSEVTKRDRVRRQRKARRSLRV